MLDFLKDLKLIYTFSRLIKAVNVIRAILTVVIIAFSVITGAGLIKAAGKTE